MDDLPFCVPPSLKRQHGGTGILTPEQISFTQETLGFRRAGFSPALSLLMSAWSLLYSPAVLTIDLQPEQNAPLPLI